jgi:hypothetical protein
MLLIYYDNAVYVPQFTYSIECEASDIEKGNISKEYCFLNWGPTTDDISASGILENGNLKLTCELRNGKLIIQHCR